MTTTLLPPNATPLERALESSTARLGDVDVSVDTLLDPARIAPDLLPWLAWALSADSWDEDWNEATKRAAVAESIDLHRRKGTRLSVETVLARFDGLARLIEWHQAEPRRAPHTFEIHLPIATDEAQPGGRRATAAFADAIVREVGRVKPLREHFRLVQLLEARAGIGTLAVARVLLAQRAAAELAPDTSQPWDTLLQTEDGEPLQGDDASFLDTAP